VRRLIQSLRIEIAYRCPFQDDIYRGSHPPGRDVGIKIRRLASSYKQSIDFKKIIQVLF